MNYLFFRGNYDIMTVSTNVHTVAALLKLWFRELREPLIPNDL